MSIESVRVCLDGARRILVEKESGGVREFSLWEPLDAGGECGYSVVRVVEGVPMGRADTRRRRPPSQSFDEAITHEEAQRRRAESVILANCAELRSRGARPGARRRGPETADGVFTSRGRVRCIGSSRGQAAVVPLRKPPHPVRTEKRAAC